MKDFCSTLFTLLIWLTAIPSLHSQDHLLELYYSGEYETLVDETSRSIASGDTSFNTYYMKALSETQLGRTDDAARTLQGALMLFPDQPKFNRMLADAFNNMGAYPEARLLLRQFVSTDSSDIAAWIKLAEIATFRQDTREAMQILKRVLRLDSTNLTGLLMLGNASQKSDPELALSCYERAFRIYPGNQKVAYELGNMYIQNQVPERTIPLCQGILETDSSNNRFRKLLGYAFYKAGNPLSAAIHLQKATDQGDSTAFTFKFLGISYYLIIEPGKAINALRNALEKDSLDAEVHFFLGACLGQTTQKDEAMKHLNRSLELMAPEAEVVSRIYSEQGNILRLEMKYQEACERYQMAWDADTTNPISLYYMASILDNSMHRSQEALEVYQEFLDRLEDHPDIPSGNQQVLSVKGIVEDRIVSLKEELFFLDRQ